MGFIDKLDDVLTTAKARRMAASEEARFARSIREGVTYYSVVELRPAPWHPSHALVEYRFTWDRLSGTWRAGHMGAQYAWRNYGPLFVARPAGLLTFQEISARPGLYGPDPAEALRQALREFGAATPVGR
ncbi:hypothetical protein [Actinacidiphila yeochonensis]|uniref:hypothetical protein n=1 Tax=Actinacidiphila yeochonensis TaxID=89050 RepID=UPI000562FCBB|nr:hypothetical protein [Actinacidiphila yeochonensis]